MGFSAWFASQMYGTNGAAARFVRDHPGEKLVFAGACKAVRTAPDAPLERGAAWAAARRANLLFSDRRIVCGDWTIPTEDVAQAELLSIRALLSRGYVLKLVTRDGRHWLFGLQHDERLARDLPF